MGRKGKNTTFEQRQLVIFHQAKGRTERQIAQILNMCKSTVHDIISRFKKEDRIDSIPQKGRPEILSEREKCLLIRKIKVDPKLSAPKLAAELHQETGKLVNHETVRKHIRKAGYNGRVARKKPYISEETRICQRSHKIRCRLVAKCNLCRWKKTCLA